MAVLRQNDRPDEEGIKTRPDQHIEAWPHVDRTTDLMKKGLRRARPPRLPGPGNDRTTDLMKKGLRPLAKIRRKTVEGTERQT